MSSKTTNFKYSVGMKNSVFLTEKEKTFASSKIVYCLFNVVFLTIVSFAFFNAAILVCCLPFLFLSLLFLDNRFSVSALFFSETLILLALFLLYFGYINKYGSPYYLGGSDDLYFEESAFYLIDNNLDTMSKINNSIFRFDNSNGFLLLLSFLIRFSNCFGGYHTIIPRIINVYIVMATLFIYYRIGLFGDKTKNRNRILLFLLLFPNYIYVTIHVFRDTLNFFLISLGLFFASLIKNKKSIKLLIVSLPLIALIGYSCYIIRKPSLLLLLAMMILYFLIGELKFNKVLKYSLLFLFLLAIVYFVGGFDLLKKYTDSYNDYLTENNNGLSALVFNTPIFPFGIILRIVYGLVFPLPLALLNAPSMFGDVDVFFNAIISVGSIFQIFLIPFLIKSFRRIRIEHLLFLVAFIVICLTTFNFRQITLFYPFMFSCSINEFSNTKPKNRAIIHLGTSIVCVSLVLIYFSIKF